MKERIIDNLTISGFFLFFSHQKRMLSLNARRLVFLLTFSFLLFCAGDFIVAYSDEILETEGDVVSKEFGEEWILAPISNDGTTRSLDDMIETSGRIVRVDGTQIEIESSDGKTFSIARRFGGSLVLRPPVNIRLAESFCHFLQEKEFLTDTIWLLNGDVFSGALVKIDKRRVYFNAFNNEVMIPRGRVRAIRLRNESDADVGERP